MNYYTILNTPVTEYPSGRHFGTVSDIFIKENSSEIFGISAKNMSLIYQNRLFNIRDILYSGADGVTVRGPGKRFLNHPNEAGLLSFRGLLGLKASPDDNDLFIGKVKDGYFDMETGTLTELVIGKSIADDLLSGRKILRADAYQTEGGILRVKNPSLMQKSRGLISLMQKTK